MDSSSELSFVREEPPRGAGYFVRSFLPSNVVEIILSLVDDAPSFAHASSVCREWRTLCDGMIQRITRAAERCTEKGEWNAAAAHYEWVLVRRPWYIPALLGLKYVLKWKGGQWDRERALFRACKEAGERWQRAALAYFSAPNNQNPTGWYLQARWLHWIRNDRVNAMEHYQYSAEGGHPGGQHWLGWCFFYGYGTMANQDEAFMWFQRAAAHDFPPAVFYMALCLFKGFGVKQDTNEADRLLARAATMGDHRAQKWIATEREWRLLPPRDVASAPVSPATSTPGSPCESSSSPMTGIVYGPICPVIRRIHGKHRRTRRLSARMPASLNDTLPPELVEHILSFVDDDARSFLHARAVCHLWRAVCERIVWQRVVTAEECLERKEWVEARTHFEWVLRRNSDCVPALLGLKYTLKWVGSYWGKERDLFRRAKDAGERAQQAAERHFVNERTPHPTMLYLHGRWLHWVRNDETSAVELYRRSAEGGHPGGQFWLGWCHFYINGLQWGQAEALQWFRASALQNFPPALFYLGLCHYYGIGVERDLGEATTLFEQAGDKGDFRAQRWLSEGHENGWGVPRDLERASMWQHRADEQTLRT